MTLIQLLTAATALSNPENQAQSTAFGAELEKSRHAILESRYTRLEASGHMGGAHTLLTTVPQKGQWTQRSSI